MTLNGNDFYSTPTHKRASLMPILSLQYQKTVLRTQKMKKLNMVNLLMIQLITVTVNKHCFLMGFLLARIMCIDDTK